MEKKTNNLDILHDNQSLHLVFKGDVIGCESATELEKIRKFFSNDIKSVFIKAENLNKWDSSLLAVIYGTLSLAQSQ